MAYDTLKDEEERQAYDRLGHEEYVAERLDGLPDPEQWPSTEDPGESRSGSSSSTNRSTGKRSSTGTGSRSQRSGRQTTASSGSNTSSSSSSGTRTTTDGGGTARATSHGRTRSSGRRRDADTSRVVEWLFQNDVVQWLVGWRLLYFSVLLYVAGIASYVLDQQSEFMAAIDTLLSGGDLFASRGDLVSMSEFLLDGLTSVSPTALLFAAGIVCYPLVVFVLVSITRKTPGWRPTLMYVVAALAPIFGVLVALLTAGTMFPFVVDIAIFLLAPLGAFLTMLFSANVRPVLRKRLGLDN
jgi:hypothetical protein